MGLGKQISKVWLFCVLGACQAGISDIPLNKTACKNCSMTIADGRFGSAALSTKNKAYYFDDISCLLQYKLEHPTIAFKSFYVQDFQQSGHLILCETASFVSHESIRSPMKGHTAAFKSIANAKAFAQSISAPVLQWKEISENW